MEVGGIPVESGTDLQATGVGQQSDVAAVQLVGEQASAVLKAEAAIPLRHAGVQVYEVSSGGARARLDIAHQQAAEAPFPPVGMGGGAVDPHRVEHRAAGSDTHGQRPHRCAKPAVDADHADVVEVFRPIDMRVVPLDRRRSAAGHAEHQVGQRQQLGAFLRTAGAWAVDPRSHARQSCVFCGTGDGASRKAPVGRTAPARRRLLPGSRTCAGATRCPGPSPSCADPCAPLRSPRRRLP